MEVVICSGCSKRIGKCRCTASSYPGEGRPKAITVDLYYPAEVEARLLRLLAQVENLSPASRPTCQMLRRDVMRASAPVERTGRRPQLRAPSHVSTLRGARVA